MYAGTLSYFAGLQARHQLANAQGQQIYKIDQTNIDTVLQKLNLSNSVKQDIQSSVNVGKYVITHTDNVSVPGWSGAGYAIIDPITGSDAYMISGGTNGSFLSPDNGLALALTAMGVLAVSATGAAFVTLIVFSIIYTAILTWYTYILLEGCVGFQSLTIGMSLAFFYAGIRARSAALAILLSGLSYIFGGTTNMAANLCPTLRR